MKKLRMQIDSSPRRKNRASSSAGAITDVPGIKVGHADDEKGRTGCTVVLCDKQGAVAGVDVRGAAPGTRETDLLDPGNLVERVHAVVLTGGSVFGLDSACGVVRYLEERGIGFDTGAARVPIVPAAVIYDLAVGDASLRPDARMGYLACERASADGAKEGQVGAGAGATVGKIAGYGLSSAGGVGTASFRHATGAVVGVIVVVNAFGDIVDSASGKILAGARPPKGRGWLDSSRAIAYPPVAHPADEGSKAPPLERFPSIENTTLAVVATDAQLTKAQARKVASMAHDGMARAIRPIHTMFDGDTVFALSTGRLQADVTTIGAIAADLVTLAIERVGRMSSARRRK